MIDKILSFTAFIILWAILFIGLVIVPREKRKDVPRTKQPKDKVPKLRKQSEKPLKKEPPRADKERKEENKRQVKEDKARRKREKELAKKQMQERQEALEHKTREEKRRKEAEKKAREEEERKRDRERKKKRERERRRRAEDDRRKREYELVFADNLLAELDVIPGSGITCGLQGQKPVVIVSRGIAMAAFVTVGHQQSGMMVDAFLDSGVVAELLVRLVVIVQTIRPALGQPLRTTLDAKVVITLASQV